MASLAESKQSLYDRLRKDEIAFAEPNETIAPIGSSTATSAFLRVATKILSTIGITFPVLYLVPNVFKDTWSRQGMLVLPPGSTYKWHFDATKASVLVIRTVEFQPLDAGSTNCLDVLWTGPQAGSVGTNEKSRLAAEVGVVPAQAFTVANGAGGDITVTLGAATGTTSAGDKNTSAHPGVKKPLVQILDKGQQADIILTNSSTTAPAFARFELTGWYV